MTTPVRALIITGEYPPMEGGVSDFTHILGHHLLEQDVEVQVLTSVKAAPPPDAVDDGIVVHARMRNWGWGPLRLALKHLCRDWQPDVINIQFQTAAYAMHPAINMVPRMFPRIPVVTTFHDLLVPYLFPKAGKLRSWVNHDLARKSQGVIVTNAQDRQDLERDEDVGQLDMIPIGSNVEPQLPEGYDRVSWRDALHIAPDGLLLGYFGFMNQSKGGEELVEALRILVEEGRDAYLLMIGGHTGASDPTNREYMERMRALIRKYELLGRVIYTGYLAQEQVSAAFESLDVCVLPYRDGVSFRRGSLMAALNHGCAIVTTQPQVYIPEIAHGENLWLVPAEDARGLAAGVAHVADDAQLNATLSRGSRELGSLFDWTVIAKRTAAVFRSLAGGPSQ